MICALVQTLIHFWFVRVTVKINSQKCYHDMSLQHLQIFMKLIVASIHSMQNHFVSNRKCMLSPHVFTYSSRTRGRINCLLSILRNINTSRYTFKTLLAILLYKFVCIKQYSRVSRQSHGIIRYKTLGTFVHILMNEIFTNLIFYQTLHIFRLY